MAESEVGVVKRPRHRMVGEERPWLSRSRAESRREDCGFPAASSPSVTDKTLGIHGPLTAQPASPKRIALCCILGAWKRRIEKTVRLNEYPISRNPVYPGRETGKWMITMKHGDSRQRGCPGMPGRARGRCPIRLSLRAGHTLQGPPGPPLKLSFEN